MHPAFWLWIAMALFLKNSELLRSGPLTLRLLKAADGLDADTIEMLAYIDTLHNSLCNEKAELERAAR